MLGLSRTNCTLHNQTCMFTTVTNHNRSFSLAYVSLSWALQKTSRQSTIFAHHSTVFLFFKLCFVYNTVLQLVRAFFVSTQVRVLAVGISGPWMTMPARRAVLFPAMTIF